MATDAAALRQRCAELEAENAALRASLSQRPQIWADLSPFVCAVDLQVGVGKEHAVLLRYLRLNARVSSSV